MLDRIKLKKVRSSMKEALVAVEKEHGLTFKIGGMSFKEHSFRVKISAIETGAEKEVNGTEIAIKGASLGLDENDYGREFDWAGKTFALQGIGKGWKYPIKVKEIGTGKLYKLPTEVVPTIIAAR